MARPAAHWAQEPDKGNADVGREQPEQPQQRRWNPKTMTANANTAARVIQRRQSQQTPPKGVNRGAGTRLRDPTERVARAPTGGEGATGVGGGAAPTGARGWPRKYTAINSLCYAAYMQQHGE